MSKCARYTRWAFFALLVSSANRVSGARNSIQGLFVDEIPKNASYSAYMSGFGSTLHLFGRQETTCTYPAPWYSCPDGIHCCSTSDNCLADSCCPRTAVVCNNQLCLEPGSTCCGDSACAPGSNCRTVQGRTGCCPQTAETCGGTACLAPGQTCCGDGSCDEGEFCKQSSNGQYACCPSSDDVACDNETCCRAGYTCAAGKCIQPTLRATTSTSRFTSTSTSTSIFLSKSTSISYSLSTSLSISLSTSTYTSESTRTSTDDASSCTSTPASAPTGIGAWDWISVPGESDCVPVLDFYCVDGLFDQLCTSMCAGIREGAAGRVLSDTSILLHRREGRQGDPRCRNKGCADRRTYIPLYNRYFSMQCDEFPPASTTEGGGPTLTCVAWYQNGLGGTYLQQFYADLNLKQDDPFVIRMDTCDFPSEPISYPAGQEPALPAYKRAVADLDWFNVSSRDGIGGYIVKPLNDTSAGPHEGTLAFLDPTSGTKAAVIDGSGTTYWQLGDNFTANGVPIAYTLAEDVDDAFLAVAAPSSVAVSADFTATEPPQRVATDAAATAPASTASSSAGAAGVLQRAFEKVVVTIILVHVAQAL